MTGRPRDLPAELVVRPLADDDSMKELTDLLHRAYRPLADAGMAFMATHQDEATTARRAGDGECLVGVLDGRLVATLTLVPPDKADGCPWYERRDVAVLTQFAVSPELQGRGIGRALVRRMEARARELGAAHVALDTSEHAHDLIAFYRRLGFEIVGHADWRPAVNYRSVVMSRPLAPQG